MEGKVYTQNNLMALIGYEMDINEDNPLFARVMLFDVAEDEREPSDEVGYAVGDAAIVKVDSMFVHMDMLKVDSSRTATAMIAPEKFDRVVVPMGMLSLSPIDSNPALRGAYDTLRNRRRAGSFRIFARLFEGAGFGAAAAAMPNSEVEWDLKDEKLKNGLAVDSMEKALKWLLENHPDYYMGAIVEGQVPGMRRRIIPAPARAPQSTPSAGRKGYQNDYKPGDFEDYVKRRRYARTMARAMGLQMGPKEYEEVWGRLCAEAAREDEDEGED